MPEKKGKGKGGYARAKKRQKKETVGQASLSVGQAHQRIRLQVHVPGLQYYVDRIKSGRPYSFVRHGDGEWVAGITHRRNRTSSGSQRLDIPSLQKDMYRSLTQCHIADNYIVGLRPSSLVPKKMRGVKEWLERNIPKGVRWHDCRVFYSSSYHGDLFPLIDTLRNLTMPLIFVGPARLEGLRNQGIFPKAQYITIPDRNCYQDRTRIMQNVLDAPRPAFISFSAGPAAKIMIYQLFPTLGNVSFLFDFGSLWDIYVGRLTRKYHKKMTPETIQGNLTGK